jgi:hypothetical protein
MRGDGKMNKQFIAVGIIVILLFVGLSGCSSQKATDVNAEEMKKFVGIWKASDYDIHIFSLGGLCKYLNMQGTYNVENGQLIVSLDNGLKYPYYYHFSSNNTILTLTHVDRGYTTVYTKQ